MPPDTIELLPHGELFTTLGTLDHARWPAPTNKLEALGDLLKI